MKQKSHKILFIVIKKGISFLLIAFIFVGAFSSFVLIKNSNLVEKRFFGNKADVQGVIELWSVSSFESGIASKSSHLERIALDFEKQNKGAYILISNMTADECIMRLSQGMRPDLFSFTGDLGDDLKKYLVELEEVTNLNNIILESARLGGGELLAYPWAIGGYALISSNSRIDKSNASDYNSIFSNCMSLGYEVKLKKSTKNVYSLIWGQNNGNNPQIALSEEAKVRGVTFNKDTLSIYPDCVTLTSYEAYARFISGESTILIGSQRDLARIATREKSGRESDFIVDYLSYYSDLANYIGVVSNGDESKLSLARNFAKFLINNDSQSKLSKIGLFQTILTDECIYDDIYFQGMEKSLKHLNTVPNIFA